MIKTITITVKVQPDGEMQTGIETIGMTKFEALGILRFHEKRMFITMLPHEDKQKVKSVKKTIKKPTKK